MCILLPLSWEIDVYKRQALLAASAAGCALQPSYPDGVYFAAGDMDAGSGYRTIVTVKVSENRIESVDWNEIHYLNADKKALGDAYGMKGASSIGKEWYAVSYTHLDVYKRQGMSWASLRRWAYPLTRYSRNWAAI